MINNEYNSFDEMKRFDENKPYEILKVNIKDKEISTPKLDVYKTKEYGVEGSSKKKNKDQGFVKKLISKLSESTTSLATSITATATIAVASVALFTNVVLPTPDISLTSIEEGYDYVSYCIQANDLDESIDYNILISNSFESYEFDLISGENKNTVDDLTHDSVYDLSVIGTNLENGTNITYLSYRFFTTTEEILAQSFNVKFVIDGEILQEETLDRGVVPVYNGETPYKEDDLNYRYEFIGWDKTIKEVSEDVVYTALFSQIPHEYTASYSLIDGDEAIIYWDDLDYNNVHLDLGFNQNDNSNLAYRVIIKDEDTNDEYYYEGSDSIAIIDVPKDVYKASITYELLGYYNNQEKIFETIPMTNALIFNNPTTSLSTDLTLVGKNEFQLGLQVVSLIAEEEIYQDAIINLTYEDNTTQEIIIDDFKVNEENIINIDVPNATSSVEVDYTINLLGNNGHNKRSLTGNQTYQLTNQFNLARTIVDRNEYQQIEFVFDYHFVDDNTVVAVKDNTTQEVISLEPVYSNSVSLSIDTSLTSNSYSYYLADLNGNPLGNETTIEVDLSSVTAVFDFDYINPGDALVTYNDDGTVNIYLETVFETEETDVYYGVEYNDEEIFYTESFAAYENVQPNDYVLIYNVYKKVNNIEYLLQNIAVSGTVITQPEMMMNGNITNDGESYTITTEIYSYIVEYDASTFVYHIDGVEYVVDSQDIIDDGSTAIISYTIDFNPSEVYLTLQGRVSGSSYETIAAQHNIKGNKYGSIKFVIL